MRRRRRWGTAAGALAVVIAVVVAALWPVYVRPRTETPASADAIFVLGGAHDGREELALRLAREGYAPLVVFSDPYGNSSRMERICHGSYDFRVECFDPSPRTTLGEGRHLADLARARGWHRVIAVTWTPHVSRTRYVFGKCWDGQVLMTDPRPHISIPRWAYNFVYQSVGYAKAVTAQC